LQGEFGWLATVALASITNVLVQIVCCRVFPAGGTYHSIRLGALAGLAALVVLFAVPGRAPYSGWGDVLPAVAIYVCFAYVFFHFNNMGETARRIRLLTELAEAPSGLALDELVVRYSAREIVDRRLERLLASGYASEAGGKLCAEKGSVMLVVRVIWLFRVLLFGRKRR